MARRWITGEAGEGYWEEEKTKKKVASKVAPVKTLGVARPETTDAFGEQGPTLQNGGNMGAAQPGNGGNLTVQAPAMGGTDLASLESPTTTTPPAPPVTTEPTRQVSGGKVMGSYLEPDTSVKDSIEAQVPYQAGPKTETGKKLGELDYEYRKSYQEHINSPTVKGIDKEYKEIIGEEDINALIRKFEINITSGTVGNVPSLPTIEVENDEGVTTQEELIY